MRRDEFPILQRTVHGQPLVYLDNAATTQKPQAVLDAIVEYYTHHNANVHRGVHTLGDESTQAFLDAHASVASFFGAKSHQLLFTRNTTEAVNQLAWGWQHHLQAGDVVVATLQDHHSSFVPWQQAAAARGAEFQVLPLDESGQIDWPASYTLFQQWGARLKVIALPHVSNVIGAVNPVAEVSEWLRQRGFRTNVRLIVDAAQSAAHFPLTLADLQADALVFSGHKLYGPTGSGGAIVSDAFLAELRPHLTGGGMIDTVTASATTFAENPLDRFTAGTPDVASLVGLAAALRWLSQTSAIEILKHEHSLLQYAWEKLSQNPRVHLVGPAVTSDLFSRVGVISWVYEGVHAHDVAQLLDRHGVAVRSGHHCTMPLHTAMKWQATCRASVAIYNTTEDIDALVRGLKEVERVFPSSAQ